MDIAEWEQKLFLIIKDNVDLVKSYLNKGDTFIDIGANTGLFTKMIVDELGIEYFDNIVLFEPVPYLVDECRNKFSTIPNIQIEELALSNEICETEIIASTDNFGYNKIYKEGMDMHPHQTFNIKCTTFTEWIKDKNISKIDFIKIDAEGHDVNIINGMMDWLLISEKKPIILFEKNWYADLENELVEKMKNLFGYNSIDLEYDILLIP
jgi:FkbM family methyltransferase